MHPPHAGHANALGNRLESNGPSMEDMNGVELAQKIRAKNPQIPVTIVTGYGSVDGGCDVSVRLQKGDLFPALLEKIQLLLGEAPPQHKLEVVKKAPARPQPPSAR